MTRTKTTRCPEDCVSWTRVGWILGLAWTLFALAAGAETPEPRRISDFYRPVGQVSTPFWSPDGSMLIYHADFERRNVIDVYALPSGGGAGDEIWLGQRPGSHNSPEGHFLFSTDGSRAIFEDPDGRMISVPITGGAQTVLFQKPAAGAHVWLAQVTAQDQLVFLMNAERFGPYEVYTVPVTGGSVLQLSQLPTSAWTVAGMVVSEDGSTVAYAAAVNRATEIYTVGIAGGTPVKISHQLQAGQELGVGAFSPDGQTLLYRVGTAITANYWVSDLYSVPTAGGTPVMVHDGWDGSGGEYQGLLGVRFAVFTNDGSQIFFSDSTLTSTTFYTAALDGSDKTPLETHPLVRFYRWFPESWELFFQYERPDYSIYRLVPRGEPSVELSAHTHGNIVSILALSPDLDHLVYTAHVQSGTRRDLYCVCTESPSPTPLLLNDTSIDVGFVGDLVPTNDHVIFERNSQLFSVRHDGGPETTLTDRYLWVPSSPHRAVPSPDGTLVTYTAPFEDVDVAELYQVPIDGGASVKLSRPIPEVKGRVGSFVVAPSGQRVAYLGVRDDPYVNTLWEARLDGFGSGEPRPIGPPLGENEGLQNLQLAGAANAVLYETRIGATSPLALWATTFGGEPRQLLDLDTIDDYELVKPGRTVLYFEGGELMEIDLVTETVRSVEDLETPIFTFALSEDHTMIIFRAGSTFYSLPIAGGTPTSIAGSHGNLAAISADNQWVLIDDVGGSNDRLSKTDGSDQRLVGNLGTMGFTADSRFVIYSPHASGELWSYSIATEAHQRLDELASPPAGWSANHWWPLEGDRILFELRDESYDSRRLYQLSVGSGGPVTPVLAPQLEGRIVEEVHLSPDRRQLVLSIVDEEYGPHELFAQPAQGGPAQALDGGALANFLGFSADSQLAFLQDATVDFEAPLLAAPLGGGPALELTPDGFGDVENETPNPIVFGPGPAGPENRLFFRVARHQDRTELYSVDLGDFVLFLDGFESGDLSAWSAAVP